MYDCMNHNNKHTSVTVCLFLVSSIVIRFYMQASRRIHIRNTRVFNISINLTREMTLLQIHYISRAICQVLPDMLYIMFCIINCCCMCRLYICMKVTYRFFLLLFNNTVKIFVTSSSVTHFLSDYFCDRTIFVMGFSKYVKKTVQL